VCKVLAERWKLTAEQRAVLLQDPNPGHRWTFTTLAVDYRMALTDATFHQLARDPSPRVRAEVVLHRDLPVRHLTALAVDADPQVRRLATPRAWAHLDDSARTTLLADPDPDVRAEAALEHHRSVPLSGADFDGLPDDRRRQEAARTCALTPALAESLCRTADSDLRSAVAGNPLLAPDLVAVLGQDPEHDVRWQVALRPDLTEDARSRIPVDLDPKAYHRPLSWVLDQQHDAEAMRRCAGSSHLLVRRSAACATDLPPDVVEVLAHDQDFVVRLFLAENCAQAPAEVLLEMWQSWNGTSAARMVEHPNFPRQGALRYADHPDPAMRRLSLDDPEATAELVEQFSRDADSGVRRRALRDERLSAASVIRLLDDPDCGIRDAAAGDPRLPAHVLATALLDAATAAAAAANPALPESVMHRLLDLRPPAEEA
jgi:hypothetical protein